MKAIAIFSLSACLLPFLASWHWFFDLGTHFFSQYLVFSLLCTVYFFVRQDKVWAGFCLLALIFHSAHILPWYWGADELPSSSKSLKLVLSNVKSTNRNFKDLLGFLNKEDPDIILLQEVSPIWDKEMRVLLKKWPHHIAKVRPDNFGMALYSKHPFKKSEVLFFNFNELPAINLQFLWQGQEVNLLGVHPIPPMSGDFSQQRNQDFLSFAEHLKSVGENRILIGDLNCAMWSVNYKQLESQAALKNTRKGFGICPSWSTDMPLFYIPIDHCLVSNNFLVKDFKTGPKIGSDHLPVVVELVLLPVK